MIENYLIKILSEKRNGLGIYTRYFNYDFEKQDWKEWHPTSLRHFPKVRDKTREQAGILAKNNNLNSLEWEIKTNAN